TIPKGEYGAGTVLLWDRGIWTPEGDPIDAYRRGKLSFRLEGAKLQGGWTLVRFKKADDGKKEQWLLRKRKDAVARPQSQEDILQSRPESVRTIVPGELSGARRAPLPRSLEPELATLVPSAPEGDEWIHEIKFDGYRFLTTVERGHARLVTRNGVDWSV